MISAIRQTQILWSKQREKMATPEIERRPQRPDRLRRVPHVVLLGSESVGNSVVVPKEWKYQKVKPIVTRKTLESWKPPYTGFATGLSNVCSGRRR